MCCCLVGTRRRCTTGGKAGFSHILLLVRNVVSLIGTSVVITDKADRKVC
jgi:hypothetical protein